jgi:hypothetical protein
LVSRFRFACRQVLAMRISSGGEGSIALIRAKCKHRVESPGIHRPPKVIHKMPVYGARRYPSLGGGGGHFDEFQNAEGGRPAQTLAPRFPFPQASTI